MIFVTVGTQRFQLNRLVEIVDSLVGNGTIKEPVFIQKGVSDYIPQNCQYKAFLDKSEMEQKVAECRILITHAGVGSILSGIENGKHVIVFPRLRKYKEHVDNHQLEIAESFSNSGYVIMANDYNQLAKSIDRCNSWKPKAFISNTEHFLELLLREIDSPTGIIFYSPLGSNIPNHKIGGAEAGCQRMVEILDSLNYHIRYVAKPTMTASVWGYFKEAFFSLREIRKALSDKDSSIFYMVGFYERNVYLEWITMKLASKYHKRIVYEPKNGNLISAYRERNPVYRFFFRSVVRLADIVFCQGECYCDFLTEKFGRNCVYIPNFVMQRYLENIDVCKKQKPIRLLYTGRLCPEKNVNLMLEISRRLMELGVENQLVLIGYCDAEYRSQLENIKRNLNLSDNQVCFRGGLSFEALTDELKQADFFLFPSSNKKEGHSNALTEAMAFGVIPISSAAGFNCEVIGDERLIVSELDAEAYAQCIVRLIEMNDLDALRCKMAARVRENYSEEIVAPRVRAALEELIS